MVTAPRTTDTVDEFVAELLPRLSTEALGTLSGLTYEVAVQRGFQGPLSGWCNRLYAARDAATENTDAKV